MRHMLATLLPLSLAATCGPENQLHAQWQPSPLVRLGCDGVADANATPEERPVAVCSADALEVSPIYGVVAVDGSDSYDPAGHAIVDYAWTVLDVPDGAGRVRLDPGELQAFTPLVAGEYTMQLVVTNDQCVMSAPCEVTVNARPEQDLWVELTWTHDGDDLDLHLLRGNAPYESNDDCYFGNCVGTGLAWGAATTLDDPILDLDDIPGTGPENINIYEPEPIEYIVAVHDYPGSVYNGANEATVRVYLDGTLMLQRTATFTGEDTYQRIAVIDVPAGTVRPL